MKRLFSIFILVILVVSCSPASQLEVTSLPENTTTISPTKTLLLSPTTTLTSTSTPTLPPDKMIYQFDSNVSMEDQALVKEGVRMARHYLLNNFGSDIQGSYVINVNNNPNDNNSGRTNDNIMTLNVGHEFWTGSNISWRLNGVIHETTHFWQHEQGGGPGCGFLYDVAGYSASHDPRVDVLDEGHAEYVGYMAAGLEEEAFALTRDNLAIFLSPVNRNLENSYPIRRIGVYWLIKQKGALAFTRYCDAITENKPFADAFEDGFEMTFEEFTAGLKQYLFDGLSALCSQNGCDKEKLMVVWQAQEGCFAFITDKANPPIDFLVLGYPQYITAIAANGESELTPDLASDMWRTSQWNEKEWFVWDIVKTLAFKNLFDLKGAQPFAEYCADVQQGIRHDAAFKSAFGMTVSEYRSQYKTAILGDLATCTVATCGAGDDVYSDRYKLGHLLDPSQIRPNLIVHFVDQDNKPANMTFVSMLKQNVGTTGEYVQPFVIPGTFSEAMLPGRYSFFFGDPGYPTGGIAGHWGDWRYYETDWFDVYADEVTELTFQIPPPIENPNLSEPNLVVKFFDKDGNPVPNLELTVCSYETPVKVCSPLFEPDRLTDSNGVYSDSLRTGKYLIKIPLSNEISYPFIYQLTNIDVTENAVTEIEYYFPIPNLVIKFVDVNGSPIPERGFVLCKLVNGVGDCNSPVYNQGRWGITNKIGVFEALLEPGEYYVLACKLNCSGYPFDFKFENIVVSESQVMTYELSLSKKP